MILRVTLGMLAVFAVTIIAMMVWPEPSITRQPGILCPDEPIQEECETTEPIQLDGYTLTPVAAYEVHALVLSRKEYSDDASDLSPVDLALGWGAMSNQSVIDNLDISQSNRFYLWRTSRLPISMKQISISSANTHVIPADETIRDGLDEVMRGSIVHMSGLLVRVSGPGGFRWGTSLRRDDTGNGACELMYVDELSVEN